MNFKHTKSTIDIKSKTFSRVSSEFSAPESSDDRSLEVDTALMMHFDLAEVQLEVSIIVPVLTIQ